MVAAHPHLVARGGGSIVNLVTSAMVRWDGTNYGAYAAAKTALRSLTRTAAVEWGGDNIRVNSIAPRSEEHTSELQSLMRISYAVFCLNKTKKNHYLKSYQHTSSDQLTEAHRK